MGPWGGSKIYKVWVVEVIRVVEVVRVVDVKMVVEVIMVVEVVMHNGFPCVSLEIENMIPKKVSKL